MSVESVPLSWELPEGAQILDDVHRMLRRFIAYPSPEAAVAHTLWVAHAHAMDAWESTPRIAFLSPEPSSGKTRALEITQLLVPRPVEAVNVTASYLFRKVGDNAGLPTILFDEIDTVFGPRAKENEEIRGLLNAGHRRGAVAGRCVVKGKLIETEELPAYCAVAMAGLGGLPDTILSRSIIIRMRRKSPQETVEPFRRREHTPLGDALRERLEAWAGRIEGDLADARPVMPEGVTDRDADVWEPLLAVADLVGEGWPERARVAAVALVALSKENTGSLGIRLLSDLKAVFGDQDSLSTEEILNALREMDESPWGDMRGKPLDARGLAQRLRRFDVRPTNVRIGPKTPKGYRRVDLHDPWLRYLGPTPRECATSATATLDAT